MAGDYSEITTGKINGTGLFDLIMQTLDARLAEEYDKSRIRGTDYSKVYLGSMESAMNQTITYLLGQLQEDKIAAEIALLNAQKDKALAEKALVDAQTANAIIQGQLLELQKDKTQAEAELLAQKTKTEKAQIQDVVDGDSVVGVIGKQKNLYQAQTDGFVRDAEQKLSKIMVDAWTIQRQTDEGLSPAGTGFTNNEIGVVLAKAKAGIGV